MNEKIINLLLIIFVIYQQLIKIAEMILKGLIREVKYGRKLRSIIR